MLHQPQGCSHALGLLVQGLKLSLFQGIVFEKGLVLGPDLAILSSTEALLENGCCLLRV